MRRFGRICTSRSASVVLPVPDAAEMMNSSPRPGSGTLFNILDLLAHPLQFGLGLNDDLRHLQAVSLRADGVHFPIHFLEEEVQFTPARFGTVRQRLPMREVAVETRHLFGDVRSLRHANHFL